jgi:hypothetical protein
LAKIFPLQNMVKIMHSPIALSGRAASVLGGAIGVLLSLSTATALLAADNSAPATAPAKSEVTAVDQALPAEPAECPIKKTIDGKTYCFQNDPALTKPQGGH